MNRLRKLFKSTLLILFIMLFTACGGGDAEDSVSEESGNNNSKVTPCDAVTNLFSVSVKQDMGACYGCHVVGGVAENTRLILDNEDDESSLIAIKSLIAKENEDFILKKSIGELPHEGGSPYTAQSDKYTRLKSLLKGLSECDDIAVIPPSPSSACAAFEPSPIEVSASKVKNLFTGLALTNGELNRLQNDTDSLKDYIGLWFDSPQADLKLRDFFTHMFQQRGGENAEFFTQNIIGAKLYLANRTKLSGTLVRNILLTNFQESFGRTTLELVRQGQAFNSVATTNGHMMTTAMMIALAYKDDYQRSSMGIKYLKNTGKTLTRLTYRDNKDGNSVYKPALEEITDENSPNFMVFPRVIADACMQDIVIEGTETNNPEVAKGTLSGRAFSQIFGAYNNRGYNGTEQYIAKNGELATCNANGGNVLLTLNDFNDWRRVTLRHPVRGERNTRFYDISDFRSGSQNMIIDLPFTGFFSTLAFFNHWSSNVDNDHRVTVNQALIVALGDSYTINEDLLVPLEINMASEDLHAQPGTACFACHLPLEPAANAFRKAIRPDNYSLQDDPEITGVYSGFIYAGVETPVNNLQQFGEALANHPLFARAWVQKMCIWVNGEHCNESSPEFERIVAAFSDSNFNFKTLAQELMSSYLATSSRCENGAGVETPSIARQQHFCRSLGNRLGINDICGQDTILGNKKNTIAHAARAIPMDTYPRGNKNPVVISRVNMFLRGTYESLCLKVAERFVQNNSSKFTVDYLVEQLIGFPPTDPRHDDTRQLLQNHYDDALATTNTQNALKSTFMLACQSPTVIGSGL